MPPAIAIGGAALLGAGTSIYGANKAAGAAKDAAGAQLSAQREQLEYLKEVDRLPRQYREAALAKLADVYGAGGQGPQTIGDIKFGRGLEQPSGQQALIDEAMQSPLYQTLQQEGENAVLRNASATGLLRSGNAQQGVYDASNQALLAAYNQQLQGLQGLAGLPGQTENIAGVMGNMGTTQAQGIQAQGQAWQQGMQGVAGAVGSGVGNYLWAQGKGLF